MMNVNMEIFNVYYSSHIANENMGEFKNVEFTERQFEIKVGTFLRCQC